MKDFFGNKIRVGQRVLHISRRSSSVYYDINEVVKVTDEGVWTIHKNDWNKHPRPVEVRYPERLVIHPKDLR